MKDPNSLLRASIIGTITVAPCCFTPVLVVLFGAVGLTALPALAFFISLTGYAVWRKKKYEAYCDSSSTKESRECLTTTCILP